MESSPPNKAILSGLTQALQKELDKVQVGEIVLLSWPDELANTDQPTFETLVNRGKEQGCNGVLALQLTNLSFAWKNIKVPIVGQILSAEADFGVSGGLIDVATAAAVAPIKAESKKKEQPYRGPGPDLALYASFGSKDFDDSLLGRTAQDAIHQIVASVQTGAAQLTPESPSIPQRANPPSGLGFGQDVFSMKMSTGYDKRGIVSVVNRGTQTQSFVVIPINQPEGIVVGLMGDGSVDGACTLAPGQWKDIRLVANAPRYQNVQSIKLGLYPAESVKTPSAPGEPLDTAMMNFQWNQPNDVTTLVVLGQDPVTLAYTCQLLNKTNHDVEGVYLGVQPGQELMANITPYLENARIPANGSINFYVIPRMTRGMRTMDITVEGILGSAQDRWPFHFAVPDGKHIYLGMGHTSESSSSAASGCTNHGELDFQTQNNEFKYKIVLFLNKMWYYITPDRPARDAGDDQRERAADVRGATIRPDVSARIPNMETDSLTHPMASQAKDCRGYVYYSTTADKLTHVYFVRQTPVKGQGPDLNCIPISTNTHNAKWPYIRTRWDTSQAFVVWEDSLQGKGSNVAFRGSLNDMSGWSDIQYLTTLDKGVDDPVVHANSSGLVVVAWNDLRDGTGQIYLRISRDGGKTFLPEVAIPRAQGESHAWPQIDFTPDMGYILVYVSKVNGQTQIVSRRLDKDGKPHGELTVLSNKNVACGEPQIACDASGIAYSVWREGDGDQSEVWFSRCPDVGQPWIAPRQLTNDKVYSEYPLVWITDNTLFTSYHTDSNGVIDLKYIQTSTDGGNTWNESIAQPSLETNAAGRAFVEINFSLQNPRSTYHPHDTTVFLNGVQIGKLEKTIPEGTYVWEAPEGVAKCGAQGLAYNNISLKVTGINGANYILAGNCRLIIQRRYTQLPVVAGSQVEADNLEKTNGVTLNHSEPDLALAANAITTLPAKLSPVRR